MRHQQPSRLGVLTLALAASMLGGCAAFNHTGPDSPVPLTVVPVMAPQPRVALVLEEAGIEVDLVVGTSMGSWLGAFWGRSKNAAEIDAIFQTSGSLTLFDPTPFANRGWMRGQKLQDDVNRQLG